MLSIVIPVHNEAENILSLTREIVSALTIKNSEIIFVDDGSTDNTLTKLLQAQKEFPYQLRIIKHAMKAGQSAGIYSGVRAAKHELIVTLDGDGQNNPKDILLLLQAYKDAAKNQIIEDYVHGLVIGYRQKRQDNYIRKISSRLANGARSWFLKDGTPDSGCGLKLFNKSVFMQLPYFDHMHRFLPALIRRAGYQVTVVPVSHRSRTRGKSKYGLHNRLWVGIVDLFGVKWLQARYRATGKIEEL